MTTCPACGKENEDSAFECKRCRAPLREEVPEEHASAQAPAQAAAAEPDASSDALGMVCSRCEAYNEPSVRMCTNCGYQLLGDARASAAPGGERPHASPHDATPPDGTSSLSEELSALAISDEEAAEAGVSRSGNGAEAGPGLDKTPPQPFVLPEHEEPAQAAPPARSRMAEVAAGVVGGAAVGIAASRRQPEPPAAPPAKALEPAAAPAEKVCASCGARNPPAARFCFDCGTPFARKPPPAEPKAEAKPPEPVKVTAPPPASVRTAPPAPAPKFEPPKIKPAPPPSVQVSPSILVDEDLADSTSESAAVPLDEPLPEELPAESGEPLPEETLPEELPAEEAFAGEPLPEVPPPFQASLVVEKGAAQGTTFVLAHLENSVGASGSHVELGEDPYVAPHAATLLFAEDHLTVRDEGSANGVFVKIREATALAPGDLFVAGERLFRYDGKTELPKNDEGDTPLLGAPRPPAAAVRVSEVLLAGKTGRICHRSGPVIAIGRTGCDLNFPSDALLAGRHAEIRLGEDGSAALVDLGAGPSGVFVRLRAQAQHDLQAGDLLQIGEQFLRLEIG